MKNTKDNFMARIHLIQYFLQEPAYAEIMLVRLQHLHDVYIRVVRSPSSVVLHYNGTSLSVLLQKLERPDSASDEATISIIVANLTLNQQFEDWNSFSAYIYGLIRVVGLHGGLGALRKRDPRTLTLVRELYAMYQHLTKSATLLSGKILRLTAHAATSSVPTPFRLSCEGFSTTPLENSSRRRIPSSYDVTLPLKVVCRGSFFVDSSKCLDNKGA